MPEVSTSAHSYREDPAVPAFDDRRPLFIFDGVCVLCSGGANWIMRRDTRARVAFTPAQGAIGRALYAHYGIKMDESYLLIANGRAFTASRGYLELCRVLGGWWRTLRVAAIIPEPLQDRLYALIARNRYRWFGKADYCALLTAAQRSRLLS
jgi:predicted DCC family thiol-disulfide oxidoreductase YuxK